MKKKILASIIAIILIAMPVTVYLMTDNVRAEDDSTDSTDVSTDSTDVSTEETVESSEESTEAAASSEAAETTSSTETTEAAETTSSAETTEAAETTLSTETTEATESTEAVETEITETVTAVATNEDQATVTVNSDSTVAATEIEAEGYNVAELSSDDKTNMTTQIANVLNDLSTVAETLGDDTLKSAASDTEAKVTATVLACVGITADTATQNEDGTYTVTLALSNVAKGDTILVLHYNSATGGYETIKPSTVEDGALSFEVSSLSPFAFVKLQVAAEEETTGSETTSKVQSGDAAPIVIYTLVALVALGLVGIASKKYLSER